MCTVKILIRGKDVINCDGDCSRLIEEGWKILSEEEINDYGLFGYENLVCPKNTVVNDNGRIVFTPPEPESLENLKEEKLNEINTAYQQAIATLTPTYPNDERLTFDKQETEARAWLTDSSTSTPFIDALAAGRQMDKAELVSRIIAKADAFAIASGLLTGQRQRYEDLLDAAKTADDVAAIVPEYSLPGVE